jgi:predicted ATPase
MRESVSGLPTEIAAALRNLHKGGRPPQTQWAVLTGPPGSGKTTVIEALKARGFAIVCEAAREYLADHLHSAQTLAAVLADPLRLQREIFSRQLARETNLPCEQLYFLDRALPDVWGYYRVANLDPTEIESALSAFRYRWVFFFTNCVEAPNDLVRCESLSERRNLAHALREGYQRAGYSIIDVPGLSLSKRVAFVLKQIQKSRTSTV